MHPKIKNTGFTIVELLIVIVVIGVLAAITLVAYNGIQNRANETSVQADLANTAKKLALFHATNGRYPNAATATELGSLGLKVSKNAYDTTRVLNFSYCANAGTTEYALGGISKSGKRYSITSTHGVQEYADTVVNDGNRADLGTSCSELLVGASRVQAGFYSAAEPWRSWTGATN